MFAPDNALYEKDAAPGLLALSRYGVSLLMVLTMPLEYPGRIGSPNPLLPFWLRFVSDQSDAVLIPPLLLELSSPIRFHNQTTLRSVVLGISPSGLRFVSDQSDAAFIPPLLLELSSPIRFHNQTTFRSVVLEISPSGLPTDRRLDPRTRSQSSTSSVTMASGICVE